MYTYSLKMVDRLFKRWMYFSTDGNLLLLGECGEHLSTTPRECSSAMHCMSSLPLVLINSCGSAPPAFCSSSFPPPHHPCSSSSIPRNNCKVTAAACQRRPTSIGSALPCTHRANENILLVVDECSIRRSRNRNIRSGLRRCCTTSDVEGDTPHSNAAAIPRPQRQLGSNHSNSSTDDGNSGNRCDPDSCLHGGGGRSIEDADRLFNVGRMLHLRRHRSPASRNIALSLFRDSMRLRPDWVTTDSRFAVDSRINHVLADFSCENYHGDHDDSGSSGRGNSLSQVDPGVAEAVACIRATLHEIGYNAYGLQQKFGRAAAGPVPGQRLPGPYYLRKNFDHTEAASVAGLGPLRDGLDVATRLFLLGLALRRTDVERFLGSEALASADCLGLLGESPVDPSLVVCMVQLFPLDADVMSPLSASDVTAASEQNDQLQNIRRQKQPSSVSAVDASTPGYDDGDDGALSESSRMAGRGGANSMCSASDLVFATDWPPPGSTALMEEPVMYIGPDSIGLVQHAPRWVSAQPPLTGGGLETNSSGISEPVSGQGAAQGDAACSSGTSRSNAAAEDPSPSEIILDLCCGSGIQGIAAAARRGGNAFVTCVDVNPRAVRFSRFNAYLNGIDPSRFTAVVGDLYCALDAEVEGVCSEESGETPRSGFGADGSGEFDLILANPPFVPVPPKLDSAKRRYDLFASGGSTGEEVLSEIFLGALDRLRPGGVLAMVSELANPAAFDLKLQRWVGRQGTVKEGPGSLPKMAALRMARHGGASAANTEKASRVIPEKHGSDDVPLSSSRDSTTEVKETPGKQKGGLLRRGQCSDRWTGVVFHERQPWSARQYAARRAGSSREAEGWVRHLAQVGIEQMAAGFVFVRKLGEERAPGEKEAERPGGGNPVAGRDADAFVRVAGVEKVWAPHNRAAVEGTERALRELWVVEREGS